MNVLVVLTGSSQDTAAVKIARRLVGEDGVAHLLFLGYPPSSGERDRGDQTAANGVPPAAAAVDLPPENNHRLARLVPECPEETASRVHDQAVAYLSGLLPDLPAARVDQSVALSPRPAAEAVSYARRHAVDVAVVPADGPPRGGNGAGMARAVLRSGVAPVLVVPSRPLERVTREEAERLIAEHQLAELERTGRDIVCELYSADGHGPCSGLDRFSDADLQRIYRPFIEGVEQLDSLSLRRAVAAFERSRLNGRHLTTCELMREEGRLCTGLAQFSNSELERAFPHLFSHRIIVD